eukprot:594071-Rhodomonas_salina.1
MGAQPDCSDPGIGIPARAPAILNTGGRSEAGCMLYCFATAACDPCCSLLPAPRRVTSWRGETRSRVQEVEGRVPRASWARRLVGDGERGRVGAVERGGRLRGEAREVVGRVVERVVRVLAEEQQRT